jgi:hypothetical protein
MAANFDFFIVYLTGSSSVDATALFLPEMSMFFE